MEDKRLERRLDKMTAAGRVTQEEADHVRAAGNAGDLDDAVRQIRVKHMTERVLPAVREGQVTEDQANDVLRRLHEGEDPRALVHLLRSSGDPPAPGH